MICRVAIMSFYSDFCDKIWLLNIQIVTLILKQEIKQQVKIVVIVL